MSEFLALGIYLTVLFGTAEVLGLWMKPWDPERFQAYVLPGLVAGVCTFLVAIS